MADKPFNWKSEYALGIEDIDFQHHYFLNLINRLSDELKMATDQNRRSALIAELNAYARFHFVSEENMMAKAGYPELENHRQHHFDLISQLKKTDERAEDIVKFLIEWFVGHTTGEDRLFAEYFHRQSSPP